MFGAHTRLLRRDLREAIAQAQAQKGELLPPGIYDPLTNTRGGYWELSPCWLPTDLEIAQGHAQHIDNASRQGQLASGVSSEIKAVCDALLAAYPGDFLQEMISTYPEEFQPLKTSWGCEPHTFYRDWYLTALWYAGEYEWQHWRSPISEREKHAERALTYYWEYALFACQSSIDTKLSFPENGSSSSLSERVLMSERALRRCLVLYQGRGQREAFEQCCQQYYFPAFHALQTYFEAQSEDETQADAPFRQLLSHAIRTHYPADGLLPIGYGYKVFPFLIFRSFQLAKTRRRIFREKYLFTSQEFNIINMLLSSK